LTVKEMDMEQLAFAHWTSSGQKAPSTTSAFPEASVSGDHC
jgi:hypothetical protein